MLKDNWLLANVIASIVVWMIMIWLFGAITLFITYTCLIVIIGTYGVITDHINPDIKKMHWWLNYPAVAFLCLVITLTPATYFNKWVNK